MISGTINPAPDKAGARVYANRGNPPIIALLPPGARRLLDVGCGAGDNAALLKSRRAGLRVFGITRSEAEKAIARRVMERCWVFDIEDGLPPGIDDERFDALIFSHVLEHLREPAAVIARFSKLLHPGGVVLIAVPNVLSWRQRVQFLLGRFEYEPAGVLDDTHLHFYTYFTADRCLLSESPDLALESKGVTGSVPLWLLRRYLFPSSWCAALDAWGCRRWPNLFGAQILLKLRKT